jgi:hypothetical protein
MMKSLQHCMIAVQCLQCTHCTHCTREGVGAIMQRCNESPNGTQSLRRSPWYRSGSNFDGIIPGFSLPSASGIIPLKLRGHQAMIQMTQDQRQAFQQGNPVRLRDPELNTEVVICPVALFEKMEAQMRENLQDQMEQEEWLETSMLNLARRLDEDDDGPRVRFGL